ncbi:MAG: DUF3793 family protein [Clostridiales bacterium]|nr:DUF3793 family protein [Clostridiales bacterium]
MGTEAIGYVLGQQCAPVIAGVKPSNLLIVEKGNQNGLRHVLRGTELCTYLLHASAEKEYWLLFDPEAMQRLLEEPDKRCYLQECGYKTDDMDQVLERLAKRFRNYKRKRADFPHEMGVLFGYPLNDVRGFIENGGKNFKRSGYWKVYDDVAYADQIFILYESARRMALRLCGQGWRISDIWKCFRSAEFQWEPDLARQFI